jgi:hypothetical protein
MALQAQTIEVLAGPLKKALQTVLPRRSPKRKPFAITLRFDSATGMIELFEAKYEAKGYVVPAKGLWPPRVQIDGNILRALLDKFAARDRLEIDAEPDQLMVRRETFRFIVGRIDKGGSAGIAAGPPPKQAHKGPIPVKPEKPGKRVELHDTWGFSARVPMPQHRDKASKGD